MNKCHVWHNGECICCDYKSMQDLPKGDTWTVLGALQDGTASHNPLCDGAGTDDFIKKYGLGVEKDAPEKNYFHLKDKLFTGKSDLMLCCGKTWDTIMAEAPGDTHLSQEYWVVGYTSASGNAPCPYMPPPKPQAPTLHIFNLPNYESITDYPNLTAECCGILGSKIDGAKNTWIDVSYWKEGYVPNSSSYCKGVGSGTFIYNHGTHGSGPGPHFYTHKPKLKKGVAGGFPDNNQFFQPGGDQHEMTCAVCAFPRSDEAGWCDDHCVACLQPFGDCWCCHKCYAWPCTCPPKPGWVHEDCQYDCHDEGCHCCCSCGGACSLCNHEWQDYGEAYDDDDDWNGGGSNQITPGWKARGELEKFDYMAAEQLFDSVEDAWPNMRCSEMDPVAMACDFYLLSMITSGALNLTDDEARTRGVGALLKLDPVLMDPFRAAEAAFKAHVDDCDKSFVDYIDMAVGGELRHHGRMRNQWLNYERHQAWIGWKSLRAMVGVQALWDAGELFRDFSSSGYGGPLWAGAAELLAKRLQGKVSKELFVDQTFSLVHNGGVFLNKQKWDYSRSKLDLTKLQSNILPAQAQDNFTLLLRHCSPYVKSLWRECWKATNKARARCGVRPTVLTFLAPSKMVKVCRHCYNDMGVGHTGLHCFIPSDIPPMMITEEEHFDFSKYAMNFTPDGKLVLKEGQQYYIYGDLGMNDQVYFAKDVLKSKVNFKNKFQMVTAGMGALKLYNGKADWDKVVPTGSFKGTVADLLKAWGIEVVYLPNGHKWGDFVNTLDEVKEV